MFPALNLFSNRMRIYFAILFFFNLSVSQAQNLKGKQIGDIQAFLGIPYASLVNRYQVGLVRTSRTAPNEFKVSTLIGNLDDTRDYSVWPNRCIIDRLEEDTSEDCLYLSVLKRTDSIPEVFKKGTAILMQK